jgi:hypothetical protein
MDCELHPRARSFPATSPEVNVYELACFAIGWSLGACVMWAHFYCCDLIRTRREWYSARIARGLPVPDDWDKEEG